MVKHIVPKRSSKSTTLQDYKLSRKSKKITREVKKVGLSGAKNIALQMRWKKPSQILKELDINFL